MTWMGLIDAVEHRLGMYTGRPTYERAVCLVIGFDLAQPTSTVDALQARTADRHSTGPLGWERVLLAEAIGADPHVPPVLGPLSEGDDARAIAVLVRELRELENAGDRVVDVTPESVENPWATTTTAMTGAEARRAADWIGGAGRTPSDR